MIDLAIRNGIVVDGTGAEGRRGRRRHRATAASSPSATVPEASAEIDAAGKVVAPGFVDIHSHSDYTLLVDPRAASAVHQGVTTEVVGNCGFGCFPLLNKELAPKAIYGHSADVPLTWTSAAGYFERLEEARPAINVREPRAERADPARRSSGWPTGPPGPTSWREMRYLLDEALEQGAWGYSTGLEYAAERGADEDELVSMCEVCGRRHGIYATHTRRRDEGADEAVAEALRTARALRGAAAGLPPRPAQRHRLGAPLRRARRGRGRGRDGRRVRHAHAPLRDDVPAHRAAAVGARGSGAPARRSSAATSSGGRCESYESILSAGGDWSRIVLLDNDVWPEYARRDIASIAAERGQDPLDAVYDLLLGAADEPGQLMVIIHAYTEEQQREAFAPPALRARLRRDDDGAGRPARRPGLPRRVHVGGVVSRASASSRSRC